MEPVPHSYLFVPGNRPDRFAKACAAGADAVIVDLEDAVPPAEKAAAREAVAGWLDPSHPVLLRVNSAVTEWFAADAAVCGKPGVAAVLLPKTEDAGHVRRLQELAGARVGILPMIETACGFSNAREIAREPSAVRLVFGALDFQLDLGILGDTDELLYFRSHLVLVSRLAAVAPRMARPTSVEPVKAILSTSECFTSASPVVPSPVTMLTTPAGRPASWQSSENASAVSGVNSAGLRTTVLPVASAGAIFQASMSRGKFQGMIWPTTPQGSYSGNSCASSCAQPAW
jgi:hypothetical protein